MGVCGILFFFFFKQKTAYEMRISDWSSDVCSSDLQQLLVLARADSSTRPQDSFVRTDLCEWARISGSEWIASARAHNVEIELSAPADPVWIDADPLLLEELLGNLIDNELRYGVDARHIRRRVAVNPSSLVVEDDGRGIEPDDSERVFETFYRSEGQ